MDVGLGVDESALTDWHRLGREHAQQHVTEGKGFRPLSPNEALFPQDANRTMAYARYLRMYRLTMYKFGKELGPIVPIMPLEKTFQTPVPQVA